MIGRFIQQEDIRFQHEGAGDGQAFAPSAGEGAGGLLAVSKLSDAEGLGDASCLLMWVQARGRQGLDKNFLDRELRVEGRLLWDVPDTKVTTDGSRPAVRLLNAGQNPEQRGFARSVRTDEADMVAVAQRQGEVLEQGVTP